MMYVDTSVLVSCFTPEARSDKANAIIFGRTDLVVSDLGAAEYNVVIARKVRERMLSKSAALKAVHLFDDFFREDSPRRVPLNSGHVARVKFYAPKPHFSLTTDASLEGGQSMTDALIRQVPVFLPVTLCGFLSWNRDKNGQTATAIP